MRRYKRKERQIVEDEKFETVVAFILVSVSCKCMLEVICFSHARRTQSKFIYLCIYLFIYLRCVPMDLLRFFFKANLSKLNCYSFTVFPMER